jgi:type I restriction enzyme, S subunit
LNYRLETQRSTREDYKETELGLLPKCWEVKKLGDLVTLIMGQSPPGETYNTEGKGIPFLQGKAEFGTLHPTHVKHTSKPAKIASKGSVLMSVRAPVGDVNMANIDFCIGRGLASLSMTNNQFLFYLLKYFKTAIEKEGTGSTFKAINKPKLKNIIVTVPPISEQKNIANVLSTLQDAQEKSDKTVSSLKELKRSLMKHLFTYGAVSLEDAIKIKLKETEIGLMPENWGNKSIGEIIISSQYGLSKRPENKGQYPMLRMNNLVNGSLDIRELKYLILEEKEFNKYKLSKNDVLFNRTNSFELVGKTSLFDLEGNFTFGSYIVRLVIKGDEILPSFMTLYLNWDKSQIRLKSLATKAVGQSNISASRLKTFKIPIPPIHEQNQISSYIEAVNSKTKYEERKKKAIEQLFKSMLNELMTAKIRVNTTEF